MKQRTKSSVIEDKKKAKNEKDYEMMLIEMLEKEFVK